MTIKDEVDLKKPQDFDETDNYMEKNVFWQPITGWRYYVDWALFFPCKVFVLICPSYTTIVSSNLFLICFFLYSALQLFLNYLLMALLHDICISLKISESMAGFVFLAFALNNA